MSMMRLLAVAGLGYGAYRWLNNRPGTKRKVMGIVSGLGDAVTRRDMGRDRMQAVNTAISDIGEAARRRDMGRARQALTNLGDAIGGRIQDIAITRVPPGGGERLITGDGDFIMQARQLSLALMRAGQLALDRGTTQEIRDLGQTLVDKHDRFVNDLGELRTRTGIDQPLAMSREGLDLERALADLAGNPFDQAFVDEVMNGQIKAINLVQEAADRARHPELRQYAAQMLPGLRDFEAQIASIAESIHNRAGQFPGPGTSQAIQTDRSVT